MNLINAFSLPFLLYRFNFSPHVLYLLPHSSAEGQETVAAVGSSPVASVCFLLLREEGFAHFPCSSMVSLSLETVLHELQCHYCPQAAVLHKPLHCGCPSGSQVLPANLLQHGPLSPQVLPGASFNAGFPQRHSLLWASTFPA